MGNERKSDAAIDGFVSPGYEKVADAFHRNFSLGLEHGAACEVSVDGELVVDLWGGERAPGNPWQEDTLVNVFSSTKGVSSIALARAHSRG